MGTSWLCCPATINLANGPQRVLKVKILATQYREVFITNEQIRQAGGDYTRIVAAIIEQINQ